MPDNPNITLFAEMLAAVHACALDMYNPLGRVGAIAETMRLMHPILHPQGALDILVEDLRSQLLRLTKIQTHLFDALEMEDESEPAAA